MKIFNTFIAILFLVTSSFAAEISETDVKAFLKEWLAAQNTGSYSKYAEMYSTSFTGIRRSGSTTSNLDHDAWLKDRKKMFRKKMIVKAVNPLIQVSGQTVSVNFQQIWESENYKDSGNKLMHLAIENKGLKITREEMQFSEVISNEKHESKFTSIESKRCTKLPKQINAYYEKHGLYGDECPAPKGWRLFVVVGGDRSWVDLAQNGSLWTTEQEVVYNSKNYFGNFTNITSTQVEWRTLGKMPRALIFPITAQDPNKVGTNITRFFVVSLQDGVPSFCGTTNTVEEARDVADRSTACVTPLPKRSLQ